MAEPTTPRPASPPPAIQAYMRRHRELGGGGAAPGDSAPQSTAAASVANPLPQGAADQASQAQAADGGSATALAKYETATHAASIPANAAEFALSPMATSARYLAHLATNPEEREATLEWLKELGAIMVDLKAGLQEMTDRLFDTPPQGCETPVRSYRQSATAVLAAIGVLIASVLTLETPAAPAGLFFGGVSVVAIGASVWQCCINYEAIIDCTKSVVAAATTEGEIQELRRKLDEQQRALDKVKELVGRLNAHVSHAPSHRQPVSRPR